MSCESCGERESCPQPPLLTLEVPTLHLKGFPAFHPGDVGGQGPSAVTWGQCPIMAPVQPSTHFSWAEELC